MSRSDGLWAYFALAVGITWACDLPIALATWRGEAPGGLAIAGAALSAWGPTIAAAIVARRTGGLRDVFGRWRTNPAWVLVALALIPAAHQAANVLEVALGGAPARWLYPPETAEHVAALVMFSIGEEFGWRGFAHPRASARWGPVAGAAVIGVVWTAWHFFMWFTEDGPPSAATVAWALPELVFGSILFGWLFDRSGRSMAVAIALHMGAHLDNPLRGDADEPRLRALRLVVLGALALAAAASAPRGQTKVTDRAAE